MILEVALYTRQILEMPKSFIYNKKPLFGTYIGQPSRLDIKGVKAPFGIIPLPTFITNFTIRSQLSIAFLVEDYIGQIIFFDAKIFGYAEFVLFNTKTNQKFSYKTFTGPRKRLVPKNLQKGACISFKKSRYFKISWDKKNNRFSILLNIRGDSARPSINAAFLAKSQNPADIVSVMPAPTNRRCSATWTSSVQLQGFISINKKNAGDTVENAKCSALISINRSYYKLHVKYTTVLGIGSIEGKDVKFRLVVSSVNASDTNKNNANVLFLGDEITPLPQVFITHPFGLNKTWIIQDTENMVDLSFTPNADTICRINAFVFRTDYHTIAGTFDGSIFTKDGKCLTLKKFQGIAQSALLRL